MRRVGRHNETRVDGELRNMEWGIVREKMTGGNKHVGNKEKGWHEKGDRKRNNGVMQN